MIAAGAVEVDGRPARELGVKVIPGRHRVTVNGLEVAPQRPAYWILNKPAGVVTTCHDPQQRRTFLDFLPRDAGRLFPVGRLDYDSEGLLLATNDGELALRLSHPRYEVEKRYRVELDRPLHAATMQRLTAGLPVDGEVMRLAAVIPERRRPGAPAVYEVRLREGRNRQIRRMMAAVGRRVRRLQRIQLGPLRLGSLKPGTARPLSTDEIAALRRAVGLPEDPASSGPGN